MKLWSGRFQKETDELVNDFNQSITFDHRLYKQDIQGSKAHADMLAACGIISQDTQRVGIRERVPFHVFLHIGFKRNNMPVTGFPIFLTCFFEISFWLPVSPQMSAPLYTF